MHELSIAQSIVRIASEHAAGRQVHRIEMRVGHLRQVVPSSLARAFDLVAAGTVLEGAELVIEAVPAAGRCRACGDETEQHGFPFRCSACGALDLELTRGNELLVDALEVEEAAMRDDGTVIAADEQPVGAEERE